MRRLAPAVLLAAALPALALAQPAQQQKETPPPPGPPRGFQVPTPRTFALDNGLKVSLVRYGTVPIVRAVGGLVDTVHSYDPATGQGTGFLFGDYDPWALFVALKRALDMYRQGRAWHQLQVNGMTRDFSWERSAAEYVTVYKRVIAARQNR